MQWECSEVSVAYLNPYFGHLKVDRKFSELSDLREEGPKSVSASGITGGRGGKNISCGTNKAESSSCLEMHFNAAASLQLDVKQGVRWEDRRGSMQKPFTD